ncbi:bifunctional diguanylate cyclase/phosphodiesterase [Corallincola spongiicola]|uniref:EAL domain-containing protein n=1 Tax=Corallincola spongiicola TaxID=2520508 RepID=A0ABY1WKZ4_9GAMM|nr:EAL domain-containing protein [Corallincola spongiicola]TAA41008.1 EAL domain-containing protein [Corallincola spongiicola]
MTLSRQLLRMIGLLLGLMLVACWLIYLQNSRSEMQQQLGNHAQDTATALSLTLTPYTSPLDVAAITATITALHDRGYFSQIALFDNDNRLIAGKQTPLEQQNGAPQWFKQLYPLQAPTQKMELSDGWRVMGRVEVTADVTQAYNRLWLAGWQFMIATLIILLVAVIAARLLVKRILKPLQQLQKQAAQISQRSFKPMQAMSGTQEIDSLVDSFNQMSDALKELFSGLEEKAEHLQLQAFQDDETGLGNRRGFIAELQHLTQSEQASIGCIGLLKLNIEALHQKQGYSAVTQLWRGLVQRIEQEKLAANQSFRLHDDEVAILFPQCDRQRAERSMQGLLEFLSEQENELADEGLGHAGLCYFRPGDSQDQLLSELDLAQQQARQQGAHNLFFNQGNRELPTILLNTQRRQQLIDAIIKEQRFEFRWQGVKQLIRDNHLYKEWLPTFADLKGQALPTATILALARQTDQLPALERGIVTEALAFAKQQPGGDFSVNLDPLTLQDRDFSLWLIDRCRKDPTLAKRLILELDERRLTPSYNSISNIISQLALLGVRFAIDHFGAATASFALLTSMKPNYLKLDGRYSHQLALHIDNQFFIQTLLQLCRGLQCTLVALEIEEKEDLALLRQLGVEHGQGYLLGKPAPLASATMLS